MSIGDKIARNYAHSYCVGDCANAIDDALAIYQEALEYYARKETWELRVDTDENNNKAVMPLGWFSDRGETARKALRGEDIV